MSDNIIILLTGCISPNGMAFTKLQNPKERLFQYVDAIKWYLINTDYRVLFVENSNFDLRDYIKNFPNIERFEYLTFDGNNYDKSKGKGFGEGVIINYALKNSRFLLACNTVIKITGRFILKNISQIMANYESIASRSKKKVIYCDFNRNLSVAFSIMVVLPKEFITDYFLQELPKVNDSLCYEFENALATSIRNSIENSNSFKVVMFKRACAFNGISGTTATKISNKSQIKIISKYILFKLGLWGGW